MRMRHSTAATVGVLALLLSACNGGDPEPGDPTTSENLGPTSTPEPGDPTSPSPSPTSEPPATSEPPETTEPATDEEAAAEAATLFTDVLDSIARNEVSHEELRNVALGEVHDRWQAQMRHYREQGWTATGTTSLAIEGVEIEGDTARIVACYDVSDFDVVDTNGDSIIREGRPDLSPTLFTVERNEAVPLGWIVIERDEGGPGCRE